MRSSAAICALLAPLLFVIAPCPVSAHNGAVAIAVPVEGITVDGDLSDWPEGMRRYPIANLAVGDANSGPDDIQAFFRIGYNESQIALYLAVDVQDQSTLIDTTSGARWDPQDGCDLFINSRHAQEDRFALHQYAIWGHTPRAFHAGKLSHAQVEVRREGESHSYEWRVDYGQLSAGQARLIPHSVVGVEVAVWDTDEDGSKTFLTWGTSGVDREFRGDVVLADHPEKSGTMRGRMILTDDAVGIRDMVDIASTRHDGLSVRVSTDQEGYYSVELPAGTYRVGGYGREEETLQIAEVVAGGQALVHLSVGAADDRSSRIGEGRSVSAGRGHRVGAWHALGIQDGLGGGVQAILPTTSGDLWLGLWDRLCRYDGESFTTYEIPGRAAQCLAEDPAGNIWAGLGRQDYRSEAGVVRHGRGGASVLSVRDGLPAGAIWSVLVDRDGDLWLGGFSGLSRLVGTRFESVPLTRGDPQGHIPVFSIAEDSVGDLWVGTSSGVFRGQGDALEPLQLGVDLPQVLEILHVRAGYTWLVTCRGVLTNEGAASWGLLRYEAGTVTDQSGRDGLPSGPVSAMLEDQHGATWFATSEGLVRYDGRGTQIYTSRDGLADDSVWSIAEDSEGHLWVGTVNGLSRFDGGHITSFTIEDGLASHRVREIVEDRDGYLWFSTYGGGLSRYDGSDLTTFATADGLPSEHINDMLLDGDGSLWIASGRRGTDRGGVSRWDGQGFITYTTEDGLPHYEILALAQDEHGNLWCLPQSGGVARLTGGRFEVLTSADGLASDGGISLHAGSTGGLWIGTGDQGVTRLKNGHYQIFAIEDGLGGNAVYHSYEDPAGSTWIAWQRGTASQSENGLSRVAGDELVTFTSEDGLPSGWVRGFLTDRQGVLWVATSSGLSRFDGDGFHTFTRNDGLAGDNVRCVMQDRSGLLWCATSGGVSRYDGLVFQNLQRRHGLVHDQVIDIAQDAEGDMWFATLGGVTRYRPRQTPPSIRMEGVVADRDYGPVTEIAVTTTQSTLRFEYQGRSMYTAVEQLAYVYRLNGKDDGWQTTRETAIEYDGLPRGEYVFEVKAVDADLNYSEAVSVRLQVSAPYGLIALWGGCGVALIGLCIATGYAVRQQRRRAQAEQALMREMEEELQDARRMQMSLMPTSSPEVPGVSISGRCVSANHVGGDFFQYFRQDGGITISLADVTGHAMEAAIPAVMFSGVLDTRMEAPKPLQELFGDLNRSLCRSLAEHTYVCLSMVELDAETRAMRVANCGCPYPLHYSAATADVSEWRIDAYPLGVRQDTAYKAEEGTLQPGDCLVLYSDGFPEAANANGDMFGFDRTADAIHQGCSEGLRTEGLIERLIGEVKAFAGDEPQADDMTCVVIKVEA